MTKRAIQLRIKQLRNYMQDYPDSGTLPDELQELEAELRECYDERA